VAYHELDADGVIRRVNAAECALLGYSAGEMIGKPIWGFIAAEEIPSGRLHLAQKLSARNRWPLSAPLRHRDNRYITVEIRDRLIHDASGRAVGIRSAIIDVTDRVGPRRLSTRASSGSRPSSDL